MTGPADCCAPDVRGQAANPAPTITLMNWRRLIGYQRKDKASYRVKITLGMGRPMSAVGQKRTFAMQKGMSALPPKADICDALTDVCFGPIADIVTITAAQAVMPPRAAKLP